MSNTNDAPNTAAPTSTPPAPAPEPAANAEAPKKFDRDALVKRLAAKAAAPASELAEADAADGEATLTPEAPAAPVEPVRSRDEIVRERLQQKARERSEREQAQRQAQQPQRQPTVEDFAHQFLAEFSRDPVATTKKYGADTKKLLDAFTKDAIAPGSVRTGADAIAEARAAKEAAERAVATVEHHQAQQYWANEDREFVSLTSDTKRFPLAAKLPAEARLRLGARVLNELRAAGYDYDRDLIADAVEAEMEEQRKYLIPPDAPPATTPSSSTSEAPSTPPVAAKPKTKPTKTLTNEVTSQSGARGERSQAQRKAEIIERLKRRQLADSLA